MQFDTDDHTAYHRGSTGRKDKLSAPFIAWDGEGITPAGQDRQNLVLFGCSSGFKLKGTKLSTRECLELIITAEQHNPDAIHVGFAFSYDVEMILADMSIHHLTILYRKGSVKWHGYRIEYLRSKWFQISKTVGKDRVTARIWDVWGFYQTSFVLAVSEILGANHPDAQQIINGKAGRSLFTYSELDCVIEPYWQCELRLTVDMMNALRTRLYDAGFMIRQWYGPGAIAAYTFRKRKMAAAMSPDIPPAVNVAAQHAFAGGRFEQFRLGAYDGPVYSYDIRSAYPSAIALLPNLSTGQWVHVTDVDPSQLARFGVYRIAFRHGAFRTTAPMPYFYRDSRHTIHFPNIVESWYWTPEAQHLTFLGESAEILEGWEYQDDGSLPLAWVNDVYETRAQWKREGNPSQMALKLLLNSMYGKMAQRVGWERTGKAPQTHQLEWAGYVTSHARAKLFRAMLLAQDGLLGVETDGIFSTRPLALDVGPHLGQWEAEQYDGMIYLQSGFYFKRAHGEWEARYRGFDRGSITADQTLDSLSEWQPWKGENCTIEGQSTRFSTMGTYLNSRTPDAQRNVWTTNARALSLGTDGKRIHRSDSCLACAHELSPASSLHTMTIHQPVGGMSLKHSLPWKGDAPNPYRNNDDEPQDREGRDE